MRPMARQSPSPDYRSDKMESLEGKAIARGRFLVFWDAVDPVELEEASAPPALPEASWVPEEVRTHVSRQAVEESELIGFWVCGLAPKRRLPGARAFGLAPGHHLPKDPSLPSCLRRPSRRMAARLDQARHHQGVALSARHRPGPGPGLRPLPRLKGPQ
jgi:hypothetical protein